MTKTEKDNAKENAKIKHDKAVEQFYSELNDKIFRENIRYQDELKAIRAILPEEDIKIQRYTLSYDLASGRTSLYPQLDGELYLVEDVLDFIQSLRLGRKDKI